MQDRIQQGIDAGELPRETDAYGLANFYAMVYQGMSMQAKDGASRESLLASAKMAMRSWPEMPKRGDKHAAAVPVDAGTQRPPAPSSRTRRR